MEKQILISAMLVFISFSVKGQAYFSMIDTNYVWRMEYAMYDSQEQQERRDAELYFSRDTFYNNRWYSILNRREYLYLYPLENNDIYYYDSPDRLLREENQIVYHIPYFNSGDTTEFVLYDFKNTKVGDTVRWNAENTALGYEIIEWIDSVEVSGIYRKRYKIRSGGEIVEGIGNTSSGPLWPLGFLAYDNLTRFICYHNSDFSTTYLSNGVFDCDTLSKIIYVNNSEVVNQEFKLYPSLCRGNQVFFENDNNDKIYVRILSMNGVLLKSICTKENYIDVAILKQGLYLFQVENTQGDIFYNKIIKM